MMKNLFRFAALLLTTFTFGCLAGCSDSDDVDGAPSIEIKNVKTPSAGTVTFNLIPQNATSYGYACVTLDDYKANNVTLTKIEGGETAEYTVQDLNPGNFYVIVAEAYNGKQACERVWQRVTTTADDPTIEITDITPSTTGVTLKLISSAGATSVKYAVYTQYEADSHAEDDTTADDYEDWRPWKSETAKADGNTIIIDLAGGDYIIEAYTIAGTKSSEHITEEFSIMRQDIPYVKAGLLAVTSADATVSLVKNTLCGSYYVGIMKDASYTDTAVFDLIKGKNAADYLQTEDYTGSILELTEKTHGSAWSANTDMLIWIVPCDANGKYTENASAIIQNRFTTPKHVYAGDAKVSLNLTSKSYQTFTVEVKATGCKEYYIYHALKSDADQIAMKKTDVAEKILLPTVPQTTMEQTVSAAKLKPDTEYVFYAIGLDDKGQIGDLTTLIIQTSAIAFNSSASVAIDITPGMQDATLKFTPENGCTKVRYAVMTNTTYTNEVYKGIYKNVQSALALTAPGDTNPDIKEIDLSHTSEVKLTGLTSEMRYLVFYLPIDADGEMGKVDKELSFTTISYNTNGTASVDVSDLDVSFGGSGKKTVTFTATSNASCKEYYIQLIGADENYSTSALIEKLLYTGTGGSTFVRVTRPGQTYQYDNTFSAGTNLYLYILCKDANGNYNDPNTSRTLVKM